MKLIKRSKKIEAQERAREAVREAEKEAYDKAMDEFRKSKVYPYVIERFNRVEERVTKEINDLQNADMKKIFLLSRDRKIKKLDEMSKRDLVLTGLLGMLREVKSMLL